jgi:hypothetical protein
MDALTLQINALALAALRWSSPWWWASAAAAILMLSLLNVLPLRVPMVREDEYGFLDVVKIGLRLAAVATLMFLVFVFWPALYFAAIGTLAPTPQHGHVAFMQFISGAAWTWGWLPPLGLVAGLALRVGWARFVVPRLSRLFQRRLVRQEDHQRSDMRLEVGKLKTRDFEPRRHYMAGEVFIGLDTAGQPIYLPGKTFRETHMQVVGPTRFGKGVLLGVMLEQAIEAGGSVIYIDPKADKFVPYIMADACERAGRKLIYIDLTGEDTRWAPFEGGSLRDRRSQHRRRRRLLQVQGARDPRFAA